MKADLHMHSYYSDGELNPSELAALCKNAGCDVVSLTDHDTTLGVREMTEACRALGIVNVAGTELSTYDKCEIHILGYRMDIECEPFAEYLRSMKEARDDRTREIVKKLKKHRIDLDYDFVKSFAHHMISRSHVARAIVAKGYEADSKACFDKWLKEGAPCYVPHVKKKPIDALKIIKDCGGKAVLAHPVRMNADNVTKANIVAELAEAGLDGIEAVYKDSAKESVQFFNGLAERHKLFVTCGGDFHNRTRNEIFPRDISVPAAEALLF